MAKKRLKTYAHTLNIYVQALRILLFQLNNSQSRSAELHMFIVVACHS